MLSNVSQTQCSQANQAFGIKACVLSWKSHMLNFSERMRGLCRDMLWLRPMETENAGCRKDFLHSGKKSMTKEWFHNNDFRDVAVYNSIPDALRDLHTSKCKRPHNRPYDACLWNWQNAIKFAWANKSNLLRALKNLMETKLNKRAVDGNSCSTIYLIFVL